MALTETLHHENVELYCEENEVLVTVKKDHSDNQVWISITDDGAWFEPADIRKIIKTLQWSIK